VASSARINLAAALLASMTMHALLVAALEAQLGTRMGAVSLDSFGAPLRAILRTTAAPSVQPSVAAADKPQSTETGERPLLPRQRYYLVRELDVRPGIKTRVDPEYPEAAARRFLGGKVVISLDIDETGKVERVRTVRASPPGYFDESAARAFRAARFTPGIKDGRAVKVRMVLEITFDSAPPIEPARGKATE
jgi:protein TonB